MYKFISLTFILLLSTNYAVAQLQVFEGKFFRNRTADDGINLIKQDANEVIKIDKKDEIILLSEKDVLGMLEQKKQYSTNQDAYSDYNPALVYFKVSSHKAGADTTWEIYGMSRDEFIYRIEDNQFQEGVKDVFQKEKVEVLRIRKKLRRFEGTQPVVNNDSPLKLKSISANQEDIHLTKDQKVFIVPQDKSPGYPLHDQGKVN